MRHRIAAHRLQTRAIRIEGKVAVAQRNLTVKAGPVNIVPAYQSPPVNSRGRRWPGLAAESASNDSNQKQELGAHFGLVCVKRATGSRI
jgi:hypothetical protein